MSSYPETLARSEAGHAAMRCVDQHGPPEGSLILRGYFEGFCLACAAVNGWPATLELFRQLYAANNVPSCREKPHLVVVNQ